MTTLRDRLLGKTRRRVVQPVQVAPQSEEEATLAAEWLAAIAGGSDTADALRERLEAMQAERVIDVPFSAIDSDVWEKIAARHPALEGEDSGMDWRAALPEVAALCCDDESLQDDDAWRQVLATWAHGELVGLWGALLAINVDHPSAHLPKG